MKNRKYILTAAIASALLLPSFVRAGVDVTTGNYVPGNYAATAGFGNNVPGHVCFVGGQANFVQGSYNAFFGFNGIVNAGAVGNFSAGGGNSVSGNFNSVLGLVNSSGAGSLGNLLFGTGNSASGQNSLVGGSSNVATGDQSLVFGSFLNDGGLAGSVMLSDGNAFGLRTAGTRFTNVTPHTFNGSFNRGYFLFTDDGQPASGLPGAGSAGLFVVPTPVNLAGTANPAYVGINVNPPTQALDVAGNGLFSGNVTATNNVTGLNGVFPGTAAVGTLNVAGNTSGTNATFTSTVNAGGLPASSHIVLTSTIVQGVNSGLTFFGDPGNLYLNFGGGNVGVGPLLTTPQAKLHINQEAAAPTLVLQGGDATGASVARSGLAFSYFANDVAKHFIQTNHDVGAGTAANNKMSFWLNNGANNRTNDAPNDGTVRVMTLSGNGTVGIGTNNPTRAALEVTSQFGSVFLANPGGLFFNGAAGNQGANTIVAPSIYASGNIVGFQIWAFSDERIKSIQGRSDGAADLRTLQGIEITDYRLKDTVTKGAGVQKKVIAQQVEKVYPQAVTHTTDVVPDIYKKAPAKDGWVELATDLKVGERVRLIGEKEDGIHEVLEVRDGAFRTAFQPAGEKVFVYGREVKDFRNVDYEAIAMLNVSATQQIKKETDAEIAALKQQVAALEAKDRAREARLARLEAAASPAPARAIPAVLKLNAAAR